MFSAWWDRFQKELNTTIPLQFFRARRNEEVKKFLNELDTDALGRPVSIKTSCVDDALAFTYAALLERDEFVEHTVLVNDHAAWSRLVESPTPLLLIPRFDAPDIGAAMDRGHRVLTIINDATEYSADDATISLPKIGRQEAAELLRQEGVDEFFIARITVLPGSYKHQWRQNSRSFGVTQPCRLLLDWIA